MTVCAMSDDDTAISWPFDHRSGGVSPRGTTAMVSREMQLILPLSSLRRMSHTWVVRPIWTGRATALTLPLRTPRSKLNVDREAFEFLGFSFVGEGDEAELEVESFVDNSGTEQPLSRKSVITALQQQSAFEGYSIAQS